MIKTHEFSSINFILNFPSNEANAYFELYSSFSPFKDFKITESRISIFYLLSICLSFGGSVSPL